MMQPKTKKKTLKLSQSFKKGTVSTNHQHIEEIVKKATMIELSNQTIYSDDSQSITVKIHFNPK